LGRACILPHGPNLAQFATLREEWCDTVHTLVAKRWCLRELTDKHIEKKASRQKKHPEKKTNQLASSSHLLGAASPHYRHRHCAATSNF
jgi:hypothetical protein